MLHKESKAWEDLFPSDLLESARRIIAKGQIVDFACDETSASAHITTSYGFDVRIGKAPTSYFKDWDPDAFSCNCIAKRVLHKTMGSRTIHYFVCKHEAAVLLAWEERHGKWFFEAPPEMKAEAERLARAEEAAKERERAERAEAERQKKLKETEGRIPAKAIDVFPDMKADGTYFDVKAAAKKAKTNLYAVRRARELADVCVPVMEPPEVFYGTNGEQMLRCTGHFSDGKTSVNTSLDLLPEKLVDHECSCNPQNYYGYYERSTALCEHELLLLVALRQYVLEKNPGDATDRAAMEFFRAVSRHTAVQEETAEPREKARNVALTPRLITENGEASVSFKVGFVDGRQYVVRSVAVLVDAYSSESLYSLGKKTEIDFSESDFTEDSARWMAFLQFRVGESEAANRAMGNRWYSYADVSVKARDVLVGATLDRFYELAEGASYELESADPDARIRVGHAPLRIKLESSRVSDAKKRLSGVLISGKMPLILNGSTGKYFLGDGVLSKLNREDERALAPFQKIADPNGNIRFRVGLGSLSEFYYRVVPNLLDKSFVDFNDRCGEEAEKLLPPEPVFTFYLDVADRHITCAVEAAYAEERFTLPAGQEGRIADAAQEERVLNAVRGIFPHYGQDQRRFDVPYTDDGMFRIMTEALPLLERYGEVKGSEAFGRNSVRAAPRISVGVSLESNLLDISILSTDMTQKELLAVLQSYRLKKCFHRLKSGAFVDLTRDVETFAEMDEIMERLGVEADAAIEGKAHAPAYRALWLNKMLEEHDALSAQRDRTFQALIKNFKTIRDADYEVPRAQAEVLRPYQVYGYKWLRTLAAAGFGGILADEMGIGKTIQTIALLQALRDEGETGINLVVCPASLVYNWQEEFHRFAPDLDVRVIAGTAAARKHQLEALGDAFIVCVTSYELLRQDVMHYAGIAIQTMVLDEAQYIKNQKAAMTKAVKSVTARRRFALTGTPIENRLAELWSIFDFLMPGFLYGYTEFSRRYETPITKRQDAEATARLRQMTEPFILRRLKRDVLKELPAKLEEVRYTRFEPEQRKVYDGQVVHMRQVLQASGESGEDRLRVFAELMRIRQICCDPSLLFEGYQGGSAKRAACLELIRSAIGGGHRMLVFSQFTSMLDLLNEDLEREGIERFMLTGSTSKQERVRLMHRFNEGGVPVFLISLKAGGTGLNLTGADVVIHYDPWWNLAAQDQATDRAHRIGQENEVTVYRLIVKDTIEEKILALQEAKRSLADSVVSGANTSITSLSNEELLALLE